MYVSSPPASLTSKALFAMFFSLSLRGLDGLHHLLFCNRSRMQPRGLASFWSPVVCESWSATYEASSSCVFYGSLILPHLKIEAARPRYKQERLRIGLSHLIFCIALRCDMVLSFLLFFSRAANWQKSPLVIHARVEGLGLGGFHSALKLLSKWNFVNFALPRLNFSFSYPTHSLSISIALHMSVQHISSLQEPRSFSILSKYLHVHH